MLTHKMHTLSLHELPVYAYSLFTGYLIGSFPTAYLLVKWKTRVDIRNAGTGNVGAHNAFDVSGSKSVAAGVLLIDILKGFGAVSICGLLFGQESWSQGLGGIGVIVGHNYPVWLRFKGGRGLAPAVGVMLAIGWIAVLVWCILWLIFYAVLPKSVLRRLHVANVAATILSPLVLWAVPANWIQFSLPAYGS